MKTETIEKQVYIEKDGKEFDSEEACIEYEGLLDRGKEYEAAKAHIGRIEISYSKKDLPGLIPLSLFGEKDGNIGDIKREIHSESMGDKDYRFFQLSNSEDVWDLATVMEHDDYYGVITSREIIRKFGKTKLPCIALYSINYSIGREIGTFEKEMELVRKYCKLHGYDISLTKRKTE